MTEAKQQYQEALYSRRQGHVSAADGSTSFAAVKPEFYADSRILSEDVLATLRSLDGSHPPYGLVSSMGETITTI